MTITFVSRVTCDREGCSSTAELPMCVGVGIPAGVAPRTSGTGWEDDGNTMTCPACLNGETPAHRKAMASALNAMAYGRVTGIALPLSRNAGFILMVMLKEKCSMGEAIDMLKEGEAEAERVGSIREALAKGRDDMERATGRKPRGRW